MDDVSGSRKGRDYLLLLITTGLYFCGISFMLLLPRYLAHIGASEAEIGWVIGIPLLPIVLVSPLAGMLSDRLSPRMLTLSGIVIAALSAYALVLVSGMSWVVYLLRLLHGLGHALVFTPIFAMVARTLVADRKAQGIAYFTVVVQSGNILGSFLGSLVLERVGYHAFFLSSMLLTLLAVVSFTGVRGPAAQAVPVGGASPAGYGDVIRRRAVWSALVLILMLGAGFGMVLQFTPVFLDYLYQAGQVAEPISSAWFLTTTLGAVVICRLGLGRIAYRPGFEPLLSACMAGMLLGLVLVQWIQGPVGAMLAAAVFGATYGLLFPAANALALNRVEDGHQGKISGLMATLYELGFRGFGFLMGPIAWVAGYRVMYMVLAAVLLAGFTFFFWLEKDRRQWLVFGAAR